MYRYFRLIVCWLIIPASACGFNRSLFFRTSSFWNEPRFTKPWLTTLDTQLLGGSNHRGRDCSGTRCNLTSIYGPENVAALTLASGENPLMIKNNPEFICFETIADVFEADFNLYQNLRSGFFFHFHLPVIVLKISPSGYLENRSCHKRPCKHYNPVWERTLTKLEPFLSQFDLHASSTNNAGLSDSTLYAGWSYSYENTEYLDFIDTTFKTGVLFPTGRKSNLNSLFDIPLGYNGFYAVPFWWDLSVGAYDWLTIGFHSEALFFLKKNTELRMKTPLEASTGLIVLNKGRALVKPGIVWRLGTYLKADHFFNGLSFLLAASYEQKNRDTVLPCDETKFVSSFVNKDERFNKWARSILHLYAEYDFTKEDSVAGTRIGIFYNYEMTGLRVFNINTTGGYVGLDVNWCF